MPRRPAPCLRSTSRIVWWEPSWCGIFLQMLPLARASLSAVVCPHFTHHFNVSDGDAGNNWLWRRRRNRNISGEPNYCFVADASSINRIINGTAELKSDILEQRMMLHIILQQTPLTWCLGSHRNAPQWSLFKVFTNKHVLLMFRLVSVFPLPPSLSHV